MSRFARRIALSFALFLLLGLVLCYVGGAVLLRIALVNPDAGADSHRVTRAEIQARYPFLADWADSMRNRFQHLKITSPDGDTLTAIYARSSKAEGRLAVIVHGYQGNACSVLPLAYLYHEVLGYHILLPDLYGHGFSSGDHIQMGLRDAPDLLAWLALADRVTGAEEQPRIVVHGLSMGAAATMQLAGLQTPPSVRCFVEDCGYTSAWDEFAHRLQQDYGLPPFPLLHAASLLCRWRYGWSFKEASPLEAVRAATKPILFIHGDRDDYVPHSMVHALYAACAGPKCLFIAPGSAHTQAYPDHQKAYADTVGAFLRTFLEHAPNRPCERSPSGPRTGSRGESRNFVPLPRTKAQADE